MEQPNICPLVNHTKVPCVGGKEGMRQGEEQMCRSIGGSTYENCPVFSQWYWRQQIKLKERKE